MRRRHPAGHVPGEPYFLLYTGCLIFRDPYFMVPMHQQLLLPLQTEATARRHSSILLEG